MHLCEETVRPTVAMPVIHIPNVTADAIEKQGVKTVAARGRIVSSELNDGIGYGLHNVKSHKV